MDVRICIFMNECLFSPCCFMLLLRQDKCKTPCLYFMTTVLPGTQLDGRLMGVSFGSYQDALLIFYVQIFYTMAITTVNVMP